MYCVIDIKMAADMFGSWLSHDVQLSYLGIEGYRCAVTAHAFTADSSEMQHSPICA